MNEPAKEEPKGSIFHAAKDIETPLSTQFEKELQQHLKEQNSIFFVFFILS